MAVIVYVETNFLMSVAMGREAKGDDLLAAVSANVRVAIPSCCFMGSFFAFEDEQKRRNWFRGELDRQIGQLRRDISSANAKTLLGHLEESRIANEQRLNDVQNRLFQFVDRAAGVMDHIPTSPGILHLAVNNMLTTDLTDNLILHSILADSTIFPGHTKILLTDNTSGFTTGDAEAALLGAGISKAFRSVTKVLDWLS